MVTWEAEALSERAQALLLWPLLPSGDSDAAAGTEVLIAERSGSASRGKLGRLRSRDEGGEAAAAPGGPGVP